MIDLGYSLLLRLHTKENFMDGQNKSYNKK